MASVESITNAVKSFVATVTAGAKDPAERALILHVANNVLQNEWGAARAAQGEHQAELVLAERAAAPGGLSVKDQKEEVAALLKKRTEDVSASDVLATMKGKD